MAAEVPFDAPLSLEFAGVDLGDARRSARLVEVSARMAKSPGLSFPQALVTDAELEGAYRFFRNEAISPEGVLSVHRERTWERAKSASWVIAVEDTTEVRYGGAKPRKDLGRVANNGHGFLFHPALLVSLDEGADRGLPLGVVAHEILVCSEEKDERPWREQYADPEKDALRWHRVMKKVDAEAKAHGQSVIHVMDREASKYDLLAQAAGGGGRFVVRLRRGFTDRGTRTPGASAELQRLVALSPKPAGRGKRRRKELVREARTATLHVSAVEITIPRPKHVPSNVPALPTLRLVDVTEVDAPPDEEPVHWTLITTEVAATEADLARIVDTYRARWLIEEFFKALKTGCDIEARQLESRNALTNALAMFVPIAWHMLLMRGVARDAPLTPATRVVPAGIVALVVAIARGRNERRLRVSATPTAEEIYWAIARMGGHLRNNGPPGWLTLRRGLDTLHAIHDTFTSLELGPTM